MSTGLEGSLTPVTMVREPKPSQRAPFSGQSTQEPWDMAGLSALSDQCPQSWDEMTGLFKHCPSFVGNPPKSQIHPSSDPEGRLGLSAILGRSLRLRDREPRAALCLLWPLPPVP